MVKFKTFCAITVCLILAYVLFSSIIRLGEYMAREARESEAKKNSVLCSSIKEMLKSFSHLIVIAMYLIKCISKEDLW